MSWRHLGVWLVDYPKSLQSYQVGVSIDCSYVDCSYADCRYADCRYADCRYAVIMLSIIEPIYIYINITLRWKLMSVTNTTLAN